jgi:hypothetical protein
MSKETKTEEIQQKSEVKPALPEVNSRLLMSVQTVGQTGKSTLFNALISWLKFAGVPFAAIDCDTVHQTLSARNPGLVPLEDGLKDEEAFQGLIESLPDQPVILIDVPAQATEEILRWFHRFKVLDLFESKGIRMTIPLFASNELKTTHPASVAVQKLFLDRADYILVRNPATCKKSDEFERSPFFRWLASRATPIVDVPRITGDSLQAWEKLEKAGDRRLSLDEVTDPKFSRLPPLAKADLQAFRNAMHAQFERIASERLIEDDALIQRRVFQVEPFPTFDVAAGALKDPWLT